MYYTQEVWHPTSQLVADGVQALKGSGLAVAIDEVSNEHAQGWHVNLSSRGAVDTEGQARVLHGVTLPSRVKDT